ncbi:MAG: choice-of-anchor tandem repeat GloVer-containing protein [Bryobacteraceae bacterium]|jgi:hypothetical protein
MLRKVLFLPLIASACFGQSGTPVFKVIYSPPSGGTIGYLQDLVEVQPGLFYALSTRATNTSGATIFSVTSSGTFKPIYSFPFTSGTNVETLVQSSNGLLYGSGYSSYNFYYSVSPSGENLQQFAFPGQHPHQWGSENWTITAPPGEFYDKAGMNVGNSVIQGFARIEESGKITILHQFSATDGYPDPQANIVYGPDGNIYGIGNQQYGTAPPGFIYRFTPAGVYSILLNFPPFPGSGLGYPLVAASDGNLYGTFPAGGTNNTGYVYQASLSGQYQVMANFPAHGMVQPGGTLLAAADGNVYGTTNSNDIFRYDVAKKELSKVYSVPESGARCYCQLIEGMDGKLYGLGAVGGPFPGIGSIFSLDIGLPKPLPLVSGLYPASGTVGQKVVLWGNYLLGATSVTFNGTPAGTAVSTSMQSVVATVPPGAISGPVTVTTANGSFTTTQAFTVQ